MTKINFLRPAALALVTLIGGFQLRTADAAELARFDRCDDRAVDYGMGYCDGATGGNWSTGDVTYSCNADGSVTIWEVNCYN